MYMIKFSIPQTAGNVQTEICRNPVIFSLTELTGIGSIKVNIMRERVELL